MNFLSISQFLNSSSSSSISYSSSSLSFFFTISIIFILIIIFFLHPHHYLFFPRPFLFRLLFFLIIIIIIFLFFPLPLLLLPPFHLLPLPLLHVFLPISHITLPVGKTTLYLANLWSSPSSHKAIYYRIPQSSCSQPMASWYKGKTLFKMLCKVPIQQVWIPCECLVVTGDPFAANVVLVNGCNLVCLLYFCTSCIVHWVELTSCIVNGLL